MTRTQPEATQLEASHHEITEGKVATVNNDDRNRRRYITVPEETTEGPGSKINRRSYEKGQELQTA